MFYVLIYRNKIAIENWSAKISYVKMLFLELKDSINTQIEHK